MKPRDLSLWLLPTLLSACAIGPDYVRPPTPLPADYSEADVGTPEARLNQDWWTLFKDPLLNDLIAQALKQNADLQMAVARVEEADGLLRQVGGALLPEIDANASQTRTRSSSTDAIPLGNNPAVQKKIDLTLSTSFEIDLWGKLRRATESARASALASRYAQDTLALSLAGLVSQAYFSLRSLDAQVKVAKDTLLSRENALNIAKARLAGGLASDLDVRQAEGARAAADVQAADLAQQRALMEHQLALLTGRMALKIPPGSLDALPVPPAPPAGLPSRLLEGRPDVRQAEAQLIAANARIGVAKAALFPTLSLTGLLGGESQQLSGIFTSPSKIWTSAFALSLPIFDFGRRDGQVDQITAQQKQALAAYQKAVQNAFKDVNDALITLRRSTEKERGVEIQVKAAQKALQLAELRYQAGYSPYLEVLDAQRSFNDASLSLLRIRQTRLTTSVDLFRALGGGWQDHNPVD